MLVSHRTSLNECAPKAIRGLRLRDRLSTTVFTLLRATAHLSRRILFLVVRNMSRVDPAVAVGAPRVRRSSAS